MTSTTWKLAAYFARTFQFLEKWPRGDFPAPQSAFGTAPSWLQTRSPGCGNTSNTQTHTGEYVACGEWRFLGDLQVRSSVFMLQTSRKLHCTLSHLSILQFLHVKIMITYVIMYLCVVLKCSTLIRVLCIVYSGTFLLWTHWDHSKCPCFLITEVKLVKFGTRNGVLNTGVSLV